MAKIHQNAQTGRLNERQQAAGYAYGANAVKPEMLGRFPKAPAGGPPTDMTVAGPWGAGRPSGGTKKAAGGGSKKKASGGGGAKKTPDKAPVSTSKPQTLPEGGLRHVGGAGSSPANFAGDIAPMPTPRPATEFSPDLAPSPNPYQPGSPVDPRQSARSMAPAFQGPPIPPSPYDALTGRDMLNNPPGNPFMNDRDVLAALVAQLTGGGGGTDPTQTGATAAPPVIQPGVASGSSPILNSGSQSVVGGSRPVIDVMKMFRGG